MSTAYTLVASGFGGLLALGFAWLDGSGHAAAMFVIILVAGLVRMAWEESRRPRLPKDRIGRSWVGQRSYRIRVKR